ncbi:MAG: CoA transferase [bacterium]
MGGPLSHLRVIELGSGVPAAAAGKLLAGLGATVLKIEPPGGDPERRRGPFSPGKEARHHPGGGFLFLNGGKRSLEVDLTRQGGRERLWRLAAGAELVIHNLPRAKMEARGIVYGRLARDNPSLVLLSITPFGLSGPYADYRGGELVAMHGGGWGWLCPGKSSPLQLPPLRPFGRHAQLHAGLHGAAAALAACLGARNSGVGERIDLSEQEVVTLLLGRHLAAYSYAGEIDGRDSATLYEPMSLYPCRDGYVYLICAEQAQWSRLAGLMGNPEWAEGLQLRELSERKTRWVKEQVSAWTIGFTMEELFHLCQRERVGAAPVFSFAQIENQPHLRARGMFARQPRPGLEPVQVIGAPVRVEGQAPFWLGGAPAPELDEARTEADDLFRPHPRGGGSGRVSGDSPPPTPPPAPLAGIRVIDFSWVWAGPHCTGILALLGAEVIKVESSQRADLTRRSRLPPKGMEPSLNNSGYFNQLNLGKKSIGINLAHPQGLALAQELLAGADVMVSNFGTGVVERLGLGAEKMRTLNPRLIVAMISGLGQTGPARLYTGYGPLISALGGLVGQTGYGDGMPRDVGMAYGDPNGGVYTAVAILAALNARGSPRGSPRGNGGAPPVIDTSMWEAMLFSSFDGWMNHALGNEPYPHMGNRDPYCAPHNLYRCRGGDAWLAIAVTDERAWRGLCGALERPDWARDGRLADAAGRKAAEDMLDKAIGAWCAGRDRWEATRILQGQGVPAFPCLSARDLVADPHLEARGALTRYPHPEAGARPLMGAPWRLAHRPPANRTAAPLLGEHTDDVLQNLLGRNAAQRAELRKLGAIE